MGVSPPEQIIGVACLVAHGTGLLFELQKPHKWSTDGNGTLHVGVGCIGGAVEPGETPEQALQREALEEIGCGLKLWPAQETTEVAPDGRTWSRRWTGGCVAPAPVWESCVPGYVPGAKVAVYPGHPDGDPAPVDLPAILALTAEQMLRLGGDRRTLAEAIGDGATLRERRPVPRDACLKLLGTTDVLYRMSGPDARLTAAILDAAQRHSRE